MAERDARLLNLQDYQNTTAPTVAELTGSQQQAVNPLDAIFSDYNSILGNPNYYTTTGGPNGGTISSLLNQKSVAQKNYARNKADAENLYGTLTEDIKTDGTALQGRYDTSMTEESGRRSDYDAILQQRKTTETENRQNAAAEIGLSIESLQSTPNSALDEIMAGSQAASENWQNLFAANKLFEEGSTNRQVTGANYSKSNQILGMKRFLDDQNAQLDAALAAERSKTPTQQLSEFGKTVQGGILDQVSEMFASPEDLPLYSENPLIARQQQAFETFQDNGRQRKMGNPADQEWYTATYAEIVRKINDKQGGVDPGLNPEEKQFMEAFDISATGLGIINPELLYSQY